MENLPTKESSQLVTETTKPSSSSQVLNFQDQITGLIPLAGTLKITDEQKDILYRPVREEDVEIRPDGLIYLPWMEYVSRLKEAFGLKWAIIPQGKPAVQGNFVLWGWWLILDEKPYGYAVGEQEYQPSNARMSYTDALEGSKSNALMRLCKGIGISLELWKPSYVRAWKEKFAETYKDDRGRTLWRKKMDEKKVVPIASQSSDSATITDPQRKRFYAIAKSTGASDQDIKQWLKTNYNIEHTKDIPKDHYEEICEQVKYALKDPEPEEEEQ